MIHAVSLPHRDLDCSREVGGYWEWKSSSASEQGSVLSLVQSHECAETIMQNDRVLQLKHPVGSSSMATRVSNGHDCIHRQTVPHRQTEAPSVSPH